MIGEYLIRKAFKLVKVYGNSHLPVQPREAVDGLFIKAESVREDGSLPLLARARPYLKDPYESYFCGDPACMTAVGDDCPSGKCRPFDDYFDGYGAALLTGKINGIVVVDLDPRNIPGFRSIKSEIQKIGMRLGPLPKTWAVRTPRGGCHLYYGWKGSFPTSKLTTLPGVDFLGDNAKVLLPPYSSSHGVYSWIFPPSDPITPLPDWVFDAISQQIKFNLNKSIDQPSWYKNDNLLERDAVKAALAAIPISAVYGNHDLFCTIGYACCSSGYTEDFVNWSRSDPNQSKWVTAAQLRNFAKPGGVHLGSLFKLAEDYGFTFKGVSN